MSSSVRRRRRTLEERVGASIRHVRPGDLAGRGEPLPRDRGGGRVSANPGAGGDDGVQVEHVTVYGTASQTIVDGGGAIGFDREASPPTERRGFETFSAQLAADGEVFAIPIDVTGRLIIHLGWRWESYRCKGDLTITRTRNGTDVARTYDLGRIRSTEPAPTTLPGWDVRAGDTITITLPNDSGADQVLAEAEVVLDITAVASPTSTTRLPVVAPTSLSVVDVARSSGMYTLTAPTGTEVGDQLIVWFDHIWRGADGVLSVTEPAGWTQLWGDQIQTPWTTLGEFAVQVWTKTATQDDIDNGFVFAITPETASFGTSRCRAITVPQASWGSSVAIDSSLGNGSSPDELSAPSSWGLLLTVSSAPPTGGGARLASTADATQQYEGVAAQHHVLIWTNDSGVATVTWSGGNPDAACASVMMGVSP